jgi:hypothetical protein
MISEVMHWLIVDFYFVLRLMFFLFQWFGIEIVMIFLVQRLAVDKKIVQTLIPGSCAELNMIMYCFYIMFVFALYLLNF